MTYCTRCGEPAIGYGVYCASCGAQIVHPNLAEGSAEPERPTQDAPGRDLARPDAQAQTVYVPWRAWMWPPGQLRRSVIAGLGTFASSVVLSGVLATILLLAVLSAISAIFGGIGGQSAATAPDSSNLGDLLRVYVPFSAYLFFASHLGPLDASGLGGATYSVVGIGSLTIALSAVLIPFFVQRRAERKLPISTAGTAFLRGSFVGVPYLLGAVVLYVPSVVSIGPSALGLSLRPSPFGIVLAGLLAGLGGGLGGASVRVLKGGMASSAVRGAARATAGIALGVVVTTVIAATWFAITLATQSSSQSVSSSTVQTPSAALQHLGWAIAALVPYYLFNAIALIWSATLDGALFSASSLHPLLYAGPAIGAALGALQLRLRADRVEQVSYATCFALGTAAIGLATTPEIVNGASLLPNAWLGIAVAALMGAAAALAAPHVLTFAPVRAFASGGLAWALKPLLGLWPRDLDDHSPQSPVARIKPRPKATHPVRLHVGAMYAAIAIGLLILLSGGLLANSQLTNRFSPEAAALAYLSAQTEGDVNGMWALMTFNTKALSAPSPFLTRGALKAMLAVAGNRDLSAFNLAHSTREDDSDYSVTINFKRAGEPATADLHLQRDSTHANWLIYPYWRVVVVPSVVNITTYQPAGQLTLDGIDTGLSSTTGSIVVIPGLHRLDLAPTDIFAGDSRLIDASGDVDVAFDAHPSATTSAALAKAIGSYIAQCAQARSLNPSGCPNSASPIAGYRQSRIHWTPVGDPLVGNTVNSGAAMDSVVGSGAWQMHISFDYWSDSGSARVRRWDQDITGTFSVTLLWNGSEFVVTTQTGATLSATNGASSVPAPSITAVFSSVQVFGGSSWNVSGQYFTPRQTVEAFLHQSPYPGSAAALGLVVSPDGTFSGYFPLASHPGAATIEACDSAGLCATVPITAP